MESSAAVSTRADACELATIQDLPDELLRDILDRIESDPDKQVPLDRRQYLSQESFKQPSPDPEPSEFQRAIDVGNFRLACRRFARIGAVHQFARVTTRFSRKGFTRLESIATTPHLAQQVKKFSYMVPFFYAEGREPHPDLLSSLEGSLGTTQGQHFVDKLNEQKEIVATQRDLRVLKRALSAFTSLQHVQILRVQDRADAELIGYIRHHEGLSQLVQLNWAPACSHSTKTLGEALLASGSPCSRFSSPMLSPQSAVALMTGKDAASLEASSVSFDEVEMDAHQENINGNGTSDEEVDVGTGHVSSLAHFRDQSSGSSALVSGYPLTRRLPTEIGTLASRLTCLELHFDDTGGGNGDLDAKMSALSGVFKAVFTAAHNMQALHIGFPAHRPLTLPLEEIFHNVRFEKLLAFGIQAWKLDAEEVVSLARRHKDRLRGLRLRDVLLNEGSRWRDVLIALRSDMPRLDWVSLRRIGYTRFFEEQFAATGAEVPDDPHDFMSESDDEDDETLDTHDDEHSQDNYTESVRSDDAEQHDAIPDAVTNHAGEGPSDAIYFDPSTPTGPQTLQGDDSANAPSTIASSSPRSNASDHGPAAHELDFPPLSPDTPSSVPCACSCNTSDPNSRFTSHHRSRYHYHLHHRLERHGCCVHDCADDEPPGDDDGQIVTNAQRKAWERWVARKCSGHCHGMK